MSDEIQEFLRRAAARRAEQAQQQLEQQRRVQQPQNSSPVPTLSQQAQPARKLPAVVEAEIIEDLQPVAAPLSKMSQQIAQRLDNRQFAQRADSMADATEQADERMDSHIHQAFDHRLGNIAASGQSISAAIIPEIDDEMKSRVAQNHPILGLLSQPQSVRNAIIISELLQRPQWDKEW